MRISLKQEILRLRADAELLREMLNKKEALNHALTDECTFLRKCIIGLIAGNNSDDTAAGHLMREIRR